VTLLYKLAFSMEALEMIHVLVAATLGARKLIRLKQIEIKFAPMKDAQLSRPAFSTTVLGLTKIVLTVETLPA
jgi:hypothetical protein